MGIDTQIEQINCHLKAKLGWLDNTFGKAQRIVQKKDSRVITFPAVYENGNEYRSLLPGEPNGNMCFFLINDPTEVSHDIFTTDISIIFWYDLSTIAEGRPTEAIKEQIYEALDNVVLDRGKLELNKIYEQAENIYRGFDIEEVELQYLMQPFAGLRIEGTLKYKKQC